MLKRKGGMVKVMKMQMGVNVCTGVNELSACVCVCVWAGGVVSWGVLLKEA